MPLFGVDLAKVGRFGPTDDAVGRYWPAVGHDVADLNLGIGCTRIVFLLCTIALLPAAASKIVAVENAANRRTTKDISLLPMSQ
jgi:hypothetical protein